VFVGRRANFFKFLDCLAHPDLLGSFACGTDTPGEPQVVVTLLRVPLVVSLFANAH
jgi:hypothetical protein